LRPVLVGFYLVCPGNGEQRTHSRFTPQTQKDGPRSGTLTRYSFSPPFFCAKVQHPKTDKAKKLFEHRLAHSAKKGEFFFARFWMLHFGNRRRRRTSRVAFSFGYFSFGEAKEKYLGCRAETRLATGEKSNQDSYKINSKPTNKPAG
jgi:hypothetical protein